MSEAQRKIDLATRALVLTNDQISKISNLLLNEINEGLRRETNPIASVKCYPTFVRDVPDGTEKGKFMALDLGGTNFRVLVIDIDGDKFAMDNEIYAIPEEIMTGTGEQLFDHIAACMSSFMGKRNIKNLKLPLGFTFSFPCRQEGLTKARLVSWTKGFCCSGVEGEDVVTLLREAVKRRGDIEIDVMAVVNDTTGTLMSCAHKNRECRVGVIIGTGFNACYMEHKRNVELFHEDLPGPDQVIVNTEWGAFGDNGVLDFFRSLELFTPHLFKSAYVSAIEGDPDGDYTSVIKACEEMNLAHATTEDYEGIRLICHRISLRAAHLASAAIATLLNRLNRPHTTVGIDGSVFKYHPNFKTVMNEKILELVNPGVEFELMLSEDGSGRGAALVAAVAVRQQEELRKRGRYRKITPIPDSMKPLVNGNNKSTTNINNNEIVN
ncbi:hexokinase-2-like protein [Euroglyphus maynei]|uniref:Phosphotransferase n=1 Tax=Euroglyphus maynei TaxID=6958 RepID=A0A1Y3BT95_EURMA|nr:hexokinase-2-like protein [Euroglyphus maynei]